MALILGARTGTVQKVDELEIVPTGLGDTLPAGLIVEIGAGQEGVLPIVGVQGIAVVSQADPPRGQVFAQGGAGKAERIRHLLFGVQGDGPPTGERVILGNLFGRCKTP